MSCAHLRIVWTTPIYWLPSDNLITILNIRAVFISLVLIAYIKGWRYKYNSLSVIKLDKNLSCNQYLLTKCQILLSPQIGIRCSHHTENIVLTKLLVPTSVDVSTQSFSDEITAGLIDSLVFALCGDNHTCAQIRRPLLDIEVSCVWWRYAEITWS